MTSAIQVEGLTKSFGATWALDGVDLEVPAGSVLGLLGPNGAGKTTAVRTLATLLPPTSGRASVCGYDVVRQAAKVRTLIGLTGQYAAIDANLSGFENLQMIGRLLDLSRSEARSRANALLERFDLAEAAHRPAKTYSGGMQRRLDLAASMVGRPQVLFLDEPTAGLDPRGRLGLWGIIRELVADGTTVLLTTQYLEEADQLTDTIAVLDHGRVIAHGRADELKQQAGGQVLEVRSGHRDHVNAIAAELATLAGVSPLVNRDTGLVSVAIDDPSLLAAAVRRLDEARLSVAELALRRPSLDEVFLSLTGHKAETSSPANRAPARRRLERNKRMTPGTTTTIARIQSGVSAPDPRRAVRHALTLARRNLLQLVRSRALIMVTAIQPIVFLLLFNYVFGGAISPRGGYTNFLVPGIVVLFVTLAAARTGIGLNRDIAQGIIDRFRSLPIARSAVLSGRILAQTARIAFSILLITGVGALLGFRVSTGIVPALSAFLLATAFGVALAWVGAWIGLAMSDPEAVQVAGFVWVPLTFTSSVFVRTETMPGWLQAFADVNPISVTVNALRALLLGGPATTPVLHSLAWIAGILVVFSTLAVRQYRRIE